MHLGNMSIEEAIDLGQGKVECNSDQVDVYKTKVDELITKVDKIEQRVNEVEQFYSNAKQNAKPKTSRSASIHKDKEKEKNIPSMKKLQLDASRRQAAAAKRMQDLMRQFGSIFRQMTQHKFAWPFMQPVDVEGLGLHDYYQIIDRPMDFSTIKNQMEAKDGTGYKHVREIYSDICLVFKNAMKYNGESSEVYAMAAKLLEKFEEKWLQFLPKVTDEEKKLEGEQAEAQKSLQLFQEAANVKMAWDIHDELQDISRQIEEFRENVQKNCRHISTLEKRNLGAALCNLRPEDLSKALDMVAQNDSNFQATAEESDATLWRLKFFVNDALKGRSNSRPDEGAAEKNDNNKNIATKRKREMCDVRAKTTKRKKKP
ncbi:transcription factor GTE6 isoform X2 [Andrographis paniculata]|uniref:transcription factor GTE6 isoform X2 n=1 Tax=Andrographis paniculata TaxID=175694 RepID=UPI0021E709F8|nr:transcription factor GTE6 isoform X2 [Andrographis paniculata]